MQIRPRCHENRASLSSPPRLPPPQLARPRAPPPPSLPPSRRLLPQRSPRPLHRGPLPLLSTWHSLKLSSCSPEASAPQAIAVCPDWVHRVSIQQALNKCLWKTHIDSRNRRSEQARDLPRAHRILKSHRAFRDKWGRPGWRLERLGDLGVTDVCVTWVSHTLCVPGCE